MSTCVVTRRLHFTADPRNLNVEVSFLSGVNPTADQIAVACRKVLAPHLAPPRNFVDYYGS